jgi:translocator protein
MTAAVLWGLVAIGLITILSPLLASLAVSRADARWYHALRRPHWSPTDKATSIIVGGLHAFGAIAAGVAWWSAGGHWEKASGAMILYALQLGLGAGWSYLFFAQRKLGLAATTTAMMTVVTLCSTLAFFDLSLAAGLLLVPSLGWALVATLLSAVMWEMNTERPVQPEPAAIATGLAFQVGSMTFTPEHVKYTVVVRLRSALKTVR